MKAQLVARREDGSRLVYALHPDEPIPDGWEPLEIVQPTTVRGAEFPPSSPADLCECGEHRHQHIGHKHRCLVYHDDKPCGCTRFREAR